MLVTRGEISEAERSAFEQAVRACGREPGEFRIEVFVAPGAASLRSVHVASGAAHAQYDASRGRAWTSSFAAHLARGCFR